MALSPDRVRANLDAVREEVAQAAQRAGRSPDEVEIVAAVKYVALEDLQALADVGLTTVAENRAQELERKAAAYPGAFTWDFIGQLQSRKVRTLAPLVRRIHSVASDSALVQLGRHGSGVEFLVEVNIAGEEGKAGIAPADLAAFVERAPFPPVGLMTMPPLARTAEDSRRWFAALRDLAERHGLPHLSIGTTQDYVVAVEEGATMVRVGSRLYDGGANR